MLDCDGDTQVDCTASPPHPNRPSATKHPPTPIPSSLGTHPPHVDVAPFPPSLSLGSSTGMNHDYGRADGRCLLDQRDFLAGEPPDQRVLEEIVSAEGVPCWQLKTW